MDTSCSPPHFSKVCVTPNERRVCYHQALFQYVIDAGLLPGFTMKQPFPQGNFGRNLYCDPVIKCIVSKCVIQAAMYDTFRDKAFCHMIIIQAGTVLALCFAVSKNIAKLPQT